MPSSTPPTSCFLQLLVSLLIAYSVLGELPLHSCCNKTCYQSCQFSAQKLSFNKHAMKGIEIWVPGCLLLQCVTVPGWMMLTLQQLSFSSWHNDTAFCFCSTKNHLCQREKQNHSTRATKKDENSQRSIAMITAGSNSGLLNELYWLLDMVGVIPDTCCKE